MNKAELKARCKELGITTEGLTTNAMMEEAIAKREAEKAEAEKAEAEKAEAEKAAAEEAAAKEAEAEKAEAEEAAEEQEAPRLIYEDKRGRQWLFKSTAPKTLNIDGHPMSQEEIFDNEDVISELVYGNSSFLTQKNE